MTERDLIAYEEKLARGAITADDVRALIAEIRRRVIGRFGRSVTGDELARISSLGGRAHSREHMRKLAVARARKRALGG